MWCGLEEFKKYLSKNTIIGEMSGVETLMDTLYQFYMESGNQDDEKIKACFREIRHYTRDLSFEEGDAVCTSIITLLAEQERVAFLDGLQAGAQLLLELMRMGNGDVSIKGQIVNQVQHFLLKFRLAFSSQDIFWDGC